MSLLHFSSVFKLFVFLTSIFIFSACGTETDQEQQSDYSILYQRQLGSNPDLVEKSTAVGSKTKNPCIPHEPVGRIQFDCNISQEKYETLKSDLKYLEKMDFSSSAVKSRFKRRGNDFKIQELTGFNILNWLEERLQYIVDESFSPMSETTVARNISNTALFMHRNPFAIFEIPGVGVVEISSQKVGVVQIGKLFFKSPFESVYSLPNADSIERIARLLHEARHSDGQGASFGLHHVKCPAGHKFDGEIVCDNCRNGANGVEFDFLMYSYLGCDHCTKIERQKLLSIASSKIERIIPNSPNCQSEPEIF